MKRIIYIVIILISSILFFVVAAPFISILLLPSSRGVGEVKFETVSVSKVLLEFSAFLKEHGIKAAVVQEIFESNKVVTHFVTSNGKSKKLFHGIIGGTGCGFFGCENNSLVPQAFTGGGAWRVILSKNRGLLLYIDSKTQGIKQYDLKDLLSSLSLNPIPQKTDAFSPMFEIPGGSLDISVSGGLSPDGSLMAKEVIVNLGDKNSSWDNVSALNLYEVDPSFTEIQPELGPHYAGGFKKIKTIFQEKINHSSPFEGESLGDAVWSLDGRYLAFQKATYKVRGSSSYVADIDLMVYDVQTAKIVSYKSFPFYVNLDQEQSGYRSISVLISVLSPTEFLIGRSGGTYFISVLNDGSYSEEKILPQSIKLVGVLR